MLMSLQLIYGPSGSGKSYTLYKKIIEQSIREPDREFIVIVPEQFTMQTQRELVELHPNRGILNIDVQSFLRLAWRIFEEVGVDTPFWRTPERICCCGVWHPVRKMI